MVREHIEFLTRGPILPHLTFYRRFRLEVDCAGAQFAREIEAVDERAAFRTAAHDIAVRFPAIEAHQVRLLSCVEVSA
jgi:hypothetical protein